jgi:hypothetical protein
MRVPSGKGSLRLAPLFVGLLAACATEEEVRFGDPSRVSGGTAATSTASTTTTSGGACEVDPACSVSFADDVYGAILEPTGKCSTSQVPCHASPAAKGGLLIPEGNVEAAYDALTGYLLVGQDGGPYVVPCVPASSTLLCNLALADGEGPNPYHDATCGQPMPLPPGAGLTLDELETIATWIECGAPNN